MGHLLRRGFRIAIATCCLVGFAGTASAQVPPHADGSICATPTFWCWAVTSGSVGAPCVCPAAGGLVSGYYI